MMNNTRFSLKFYLRQSEITLLSIFLALVFCYSPEVSLAASAEHWITAAENSCISEKSYTVDRKTEVHHEQAAPGGRMAPTKRLIQKSSTKLSYKKGRGLKPKLRQKTSNNSSPSTPKPSAFTLDVGHMLQKMKGNAQWILEDENAILDNQDCAVLSSSGEKWLVRLWIRKRDGAVLRYDQYLNNKFLGTSKIKYGQPHNGKHLPVEATTRFHTTGHIFSQQYSNYSFSEDVQ